MDNFFDDFDLAVKNLQRKEASVDDPDNEVEDLHSKLNKLLKINQRIQHCLQQFLEYLNEQVDKNLVEQTACQIKISESKKKARYRPPHVFASPYFRDSKGFHSPLNEDTIMKKEHLYTNTRVSSSHQWSSAVEQSTFVRIVEANGREVLEKPFKRRIAFLVEKRERNFQGPDVMEEIAKEIRELREKIDVLREQTFEHLLKEETFELDWLSISTSMLENGFDRDAKACELMWENFLQPNINRQEFTPEEDNAIIKLTSKGETNWTEIAVCLETNRTAFQCFVRFQRKLNKNLRNRCWTEEEDAKLIQVVEFCRVRDIIPWKKVLLYMKGWSMPQLQNRWDRNLKPQNREGKWTPEEDAILLLAVPCVGRCWMQICTLLHGRTSYFCRERYINTLDPTLHTGEWTWQEDKLLLCLLATHGEKWGTISRFFKGRTDNMVNQRCTVMKRYKPLLYKRVLASNPEDVQSILPKKQFARSNVCTDVNARREKRREEAFKFAVNAMQTYYGSSFDASAYSTFEQLATCLNNNKESLRQVAKILLSEFPTVTMKRPVSHYSYKCQMKVEAKDTDGDEDEEWHSDTDRDEDKEMDDEMQEDCKEIVVKEEETMTKEEIEKLNVAFNDFIVPTAAISSKYVVLTRMVKKTRTQFEYSAMLRCLLNYYRCNGKKSKTRDLDEEAENSDEELIYRRVDFGRIVPRVIEMFVIGTLSKDLPPIIPPNRSTADSYNMMLIGHIINIPRKLDQITEDQNLILCALINEFDVQKIKSKGDCPICKAYKRVDMDESGSSNTPIVCPKCTDQYRIDNLIALFWHRFFVVFAFPTVLSQCKPSERQLQFVMQNPGHFFHRINKRSVARGVKRVYCSDDSSSNSEENFDDDSEDKDYLCH